jgi:hypothetical protein
MSCMENERNRLFFSSRWIGVVRNIRRCGVKGEPSESCSSPPRRLTTDRDTISLRRLRVLIVLAATRGSVLRLVEDNQAIVFRHDDLTGEARLPGSVSRSAESL